MAKGTPSTCSFPGCDRRPQRRGLRCWAHADNPAIVDGIYCQLCGFGPRSSLHAHVRAFHDGALAYRRLFGRESLESENLRFNRRALWLDRVADGDPMRGRRKGVCAKGHRMSGSNLVEYHYAGGVKRACRKCVQDWERQRRARDRPAFRRNWRSCDWCGEKYWPTKKRQRFDTDVCQQSFFNAKYAAERQKVRGRATCKRCGRSFDRRRSDQVFCSHDCARRARYEAKIRSPIEARTCSICSATFTPQRRNSRALVCSDECRAESARRRAREWHRSRSTT